MVNEYLNLRSKIHNEIILNNTKKDTFIINQEGKLFTSSIPNQHIRKYRKYILGGLVIVLSDNYRGTLSFDFNVLIKDTQNIVFSSFTEQSGKNFKEFYSKIVNGKEEDFIWINNLCAYNIKSQIKEIVKIQINNTKVDSYLAKQVCSLFPLLEAIEFNNCVIASDCKFITDHNTEINFNDCILESTMCLIDSKNDFNFIRCIFKQILTSAITSCNSYSKNITMFECDIDFYSLFLKINFLDLECLMVENIPEYDERGNNYQKNLGNSFTFLPDSCPHLKKLRIEASLDNIDFLSRMPFLEGISILSSSGIMDYPLLKLNDYNFTKKLEEKNKTRVRIKQILNANEEEEKKEYYITESEIERVLEMNAVYRTIYTTSFESDAIIKCGDNYKDFLSYLLNPNFLKLDGYYENYFGHLIFRHLEKDPYYITSKLLELKYLYNALFYDEPKDKIVFAKKCLFYIDGRPIIFNKEKKMKPIITEEEALKFRKKYPIRPCKKEDMTQDYLDQLKKFIEMDEVFGANGVTVSEFISAMQCVGLDISLNLVYKDLLERLQSGHEIIYKLHKEAEKWKYEKHLRNVHQKCLRAFAKMINCNYSSFTIEELIMIAKYLPGERSKQELNFNPFFDLNTLCLDETSLIKKIDLKCNGNFTKLLKSINDIKELECNFVRKEPVLTKEELSKIKTLSLRSKDY